MRIWWRGEGVANKRWGKRLGDDDWVMMRLREWGVNGGGKCGVNGEGMEDNEYGGKNGIKDEWIEGVEREVIINIGCFS